MTKKNCRSCAQQFEVTDEDLDFYKKISPVLEGKTYVMVDPAAAIDEAEKWRRLWRELFLK